MTKPSLREVIGRLGPIQVIDPVQSGSPGVIDLRPAGNLADVNVATAVHALLRRGVRGGAALDALEQVMESGAASVAAPLVEAGGHLERELRIAGIEAVVVVNAEPVRHAEHQH